MRRGGIPVSGAGPPRRRPQKGNLMTERDDHIEKLEARLDELHAELNRIEAEAVEIDQERGNRYQDHILELKSKARETRETLAKVKESNEDSWKELKEDAENVWSTFKRNFSKAKSEFKRGYKEGMED
jgi:predicted  nucleic acid-binding Zn-ribbon protein